MTSTSITTLSLHDALPIFGEPVRELPHTYEGGPIEEISDVAVFCRGCLTMSGASYEAEPQLAERLMERLADQETTWPLRSEEHTSELQSRLHLVCRLLLEK